MLRDFQAILLHYNSSELVPGSGLSHASLSRGQSRDNQSHRAGALSIFSPISKHLLTVPFEDGHGKILMSLYTSHQNPASNMQQARIALANPSDPAIQSHPCSPTSTSFYEFPRLLAGPSKSASFPKTSTNHGCDGQILLYTSSPKQQPSSKISLLQKQSKQEKNRSLKMKVEPKAVLESKDRKYVTVSRLWMSHTKPKRTT